MARNFLPFQSANYIGAFSSSGFNRSRGKGIMVKANINWSDYTNTAGNFAIDINLQAVGPNTVPAQWIIQSVYIDNEGVDFPVYVYFVDSQFVVSCPANSAGWFEVFTNGLQAIIAGIGIPAASLAASEQTRLFFTDVPMVPYLDQEIASSLSLWLGSTTNFRNNQLLPGLGTPALGDQATSKAIALITGTGDVAIPALTAASGFLYLTQVQAAPFSLTSINNTGNGFAAVTLRNDVEGDIFSAVANTANQQMPPVTIVLDMKGNVRFPASRNWVLHLNATTNVQNGSSMIWNIIYTINPN